MRIQTPTRQRIAAPPLDIVAVMAAHGVELTGHGAEMKGLCPFHEDETPSLSVNREKGVWHCFGCGAKGNAKVFEARMSGRLVSGRDLIEKRLEPTVRASSPVPDTGVTDTGAVVERVVTLYHEALGRNKAALEFLASRCLGDAELLRRYRVGFVEGSLRKLAPPRSAVWNTLRSLGYLNDRGGEFFAGRVVFPMTDAAGAVVGMYGRLITERQGAVTHLYPRGPHRGVWNREGAKAAAESGLPVIVCESVLDAFSCVAAGMPGAIALFGTNGVTAEHVELLREIRQRRVILALDGDKAGRDAAPVVLEKFAGLAESFAIARLPEEKDRKDPNAVLVTMGPAALREFIEKAEEVKPAALAVSTSPSAEAPTLTCHANGDLTFTPATAGQAASSRVYHVKNFNAFGFARMRATLMLAPSAGSGSADGPSASSGVHIDTLDLYSNRARASFIADASARLNIAPQEIETDLMSLVLALDDHRKAAAEKLQGKAREKTHVMTSEEKAAGMEFLTGADLIAEIVRDCEAVGYVGEKNNKTLGYLIATSRKMREPLSAVLVAGSGAGKSALMDVIEELMPPEDVYAVSDLTDNALFYMEPDELTHKLLIIAERSGSEDADYSLRELQTKRVLRKGVAVKDPESGRIKTVRIEVRGPVAVMESTTNPRMNPENANRCFVLHVDESREQTEAIQQAQRRAKSAAAMERDAAREDAVTRHRAAQRLLEPLRVVIPFAEAITFPAETVRTRRDHARFLNLIEAVAFLHQKKRPVREIQGRAYIEATLEDYDLARGLALEVLTANLDELPRASRALLDAMEDLAAKKDPNKRESAIFTRRDLVDATGWTYDRIRSAMGPLLDNDSVVFERGARGVTMYRLGTPMSRPEIVLPETAELAAKTDH